MTLKITAVALALACATPSLLHAQTPANVTVEKGYFMTRLAGGLNFPTALAMGKGHIWVAEAGFLPGSFPRVLEIQANGTKTAVLSGSQIAGSMFSGPLTDVTFKDGWLYVTHRQPGANGWMVGAISRFRPDAPVNSFKTVLTNLPSAGDHGTEEIIFGEDGRAFFAQGSATNAAIVGPDNWFITGWLQDFPTFHDFAPVDLVLNGNDYRPPVQFPLDSNANRFTGPYMPYGTGAVAGQVVHGASPAHPQEGMIAGNGTVYSFDPNALNPASTLRLEGWGFRNPYGLGFDPIHPGQLLVSNNGADYRQFPINGTPTIVETRPIESDLDDLYRMTPGGGVEFFGWPDLFHDPVTGELRLVSEGLFGETEEGELAIPQPHTLLDETFRNSLDSRRAYAQFEHHSSANKFDCSRSDVFRHFGQPFVAETGSLVPTTGADELTGYKVVRVDRETRKEVDFIAHMSDDADDIFVAGGFNKPIDVKFNGDVMLIVDFGMFEPGIGIMQANTGKVWVVFRSGSQTAAIK
jgi:hypothetical protein